MNVRTIGLIFTALLLAAISCAAAERHLGKFSNGDLSGWRDEIFKGKTEYTLVKDNGSTVLRAHSNGSASGLIMKLKVDGKQYPVLAWSWKVEHTLKKEDVTRKSGDDFAARVYVVFPGTFFWQARTVVYVWAARLPRDSWAFSPYTSRAAILAAESGDEKAGQWVSEERNYREDYRRIFGEEPPNPGAVAIMTDTDNTGDNVTAYYGDIFLKNAKPD